METYGEGGVGDWHTLNLSVFKVVLQGNNLKGHPNFFSFLLFASLPSSRQEDGYHSLDCACSNKEETGRA